MINNMELKKKAAIAIKKNYCKCIFVPVLFILCLWLNNLFVNPIDQYSMFGKVSVSAANIFAWFGVQVFLINPLFVGIIIQRGRRPLVNAGWWMNASVAPGGVFQSPVLRCTFGSFPDTPLLLSR